MNPTCNVHLIVEMNLHVRRLFLLNNWNIEIKISNIFLGDLRPVNIWFLRRSSLCCTGVARSYNESKLLATPVQHKLLRRRNQILTGRRSPRKILLILISIFQLLSKKSLQDTWRFISTIRASTLHVGFMAYASGLGVFVRRL